MIQAVLFDMGGTLHTCSDSPARRIWFAQRLLERLRGRDFVLALIDDGLAAPLTFDCYPTDDAWLLRLRERVNREIARAAAQPPRERTLRA